ncbi:MAG: helix-turn-helix transcriptional regulator, partial [Pseudomonadota bacterium]
AEILNRREKLLSLMPAISAGITPYQYVMRERLEEAKRLLRDTEWSLVDIAVATGFSSQSHFATTFKKSVKLTPLQYRRL